MLLTSMKHYSQLMLIPYTGNERDTKYLSYMTISSNDSIAFQLCDKQKYVLTNRNSGGRCFIYNITQRFLVTVRVIIIVYYANECQLRTIDYEYKIIIIIHTKIYIYIQDHSQDASHLNIELPSSLSTIEAIYNRAESATIITINAYVKSNIQVY